MISSAKSGVEDIDMYPGPSRFGIFLAATQVLLPLLTATDEMSMLCDEAGINKALPKIKPFFTRIDAGQRD